MQIQDDYQVKRIGNEVKSWDISEDRVSCPASVLLCTAAVLRASHYHLVGSRGSGTVRRLHSNECIWGNFPKVIILHL